MIPLAMAISMSMPCPVFFDLHQNVDNVDTAFFLLFFRYSSSPRGSRFVDNVDGCRHIWELKNHIFNIFLYKYLISLERPFLCGMG